MICDCEKDEDTEKKNFKNKNKKEGNLIIINVPDGKSANSGDGEKRVVYLYACMYVCRRDLPR